MRILEIDSKKKRKIVLANIKKVVFQPGNLVILIILLIVNSFAWFIYAGKVLPEESKIEEFKIQPGTVIMMMHLKGGF